MTDHRRAQQSREKTARYRERMRAAGFREILVWATPDQAKIIREMVKDNRLSKGDDGDDMPKS